MERIGVRELRNDTSRVVRRVKAGERIIVTIDGVPAAQLVPLDATARGHTIEELLAEGAVLPARSSGSPRRATPVTAPPGWTTTDILRGHRDR